MLEDTVAANSTGGIRGACVLATGCHYNSEDLASIQTYVCGDPHWAVHSIAYKSLGHAFWTFDLHASALAHRSRSSHSHNTGHAYPIGLGYVSYKRAQGIAARNRVGRLVSLTRSRFFVMLLTQPRLS